MANPALVVSPPIWPPCFGSVTPYMATLLWYCHPLYGHPALVMSQLYRQPRFDIVTTYMATLL